MRRFILALLLLSVALPAQTKKKILLRTGDSAPKRFAPPKS
ncbi:MAG: hypothetical protein NTY38_04985 [Acidobacteria bacterium]|nr:hypothetical protein [Acidobacteriota bacterium]